MIEYINYIIMKIRMDTKEKDVVFILIENQIS